MRRSWSGEGNPCSASGLLIADGTLEALKWLALIVMALDHVNKYVYREQLPVIFEVGRSVLPIFSFVLAYNLTRPNATTNGAYRRTMQRLTLTGLLSAPIVYALNAPLVNKSPWWPQNVLFMFLLAAGLSILWMKGGALRRALPVVLFLLAGAVVEYFWFGLGCFWASSLFCRQPTIRHFSLWVLALLSLTAVNGNLWALAAVLIVLLATRVPLSLPRNKWMFYAFYPTHLLAIWVLCDSLRLRSGALEKRDATSA